MLYLGPGAAAERHAHHAVQFVQASQGAMELQLEDRTVAVQAALVPANVQHAFSAGGQRIALLLVERHGRLGIALDRVARARAGAELAGELAGLELPPGDATTEAAMAWCNAVLAAFGVAADAPRPSLAIRRAIAYVHESLDGVPRLDEAAARAGLSPTRFTHRFSEEAGIPFRRFVLWARLHRAVEGIRRGANLTEAAVAAGFSDSAHLSRTFRSMFGLSPSAVLPLVEFAGSWSSEGDRNVQAP